jgi:hypothetical protein
MNQDISITKLLPEHLAQTEMWNSSQNATNSLLKQSNNSLPSTSDIHGWSVLKDDEVLAVATVDIDNEHNGYLECRVKPSVQRQGIGSLLIEYALRQPAVEALSHLHASISLDNISAQVILNKQGFSRTGYTSDGRIEFTRYINP